MKILSTAPCRLSLFGGGTDVNPYASQFGGLCINCAINLRQKTILYTKIDLINFNNGKGGPNIIPPLGKQEFNYAILKEFGMDDMHQAKIESVFDGILESGLGSSASAAVALIGAINKAKNLGMSLSEIAEKAWEIEVNKLGLYGGKQDQYCAAFGGVNIMYFKKGGEVEVTPFGKEYIEPILPSLVLFYTGKNRKSATIQEGFKKLTKDQIWALDRIRGLAFDAIKPIQKGNFRQVGALLDTAWEYKKLSNKGVSNERIDHLISMGKSVGAYGAKIMGAGSGGFILFIVNPEERDKFISEMITLDIGLEWYDFSICWNGLEVRNITNK